MHTILIVEDDVGLARGISFVLTKEGYHILIASSLSEARTLYHTHPIEMLILDVNLPDGNGMDFCTEIRKASSLPIIFLTACDLEVDVVTGLELGADDYITKPFSLMILKSRVQALFRRSHQQVASYQPLTFGNLSFDLDKLLLIKNGQALNLSPIEFKLARHLATHAGQVITKEQLLSSLWDIDGNFIDANTLAVNIRRLRTKIEDNPSEPRYIKTVHGVGYIWHKGESL